MYNLPIIPIGKTSIMSWKKQRHWKVKFARTKFFKEFCLNKRQEANPKD